MHDHLREPEIADFLMGLLFGVWLGMLVTVIAWARCDAKRACRRCRR
jgi:hypothetical protein